MTPAMEIQDRIVLVTGSTDGLGKATAMELARMGAKVMVHGPRLEKARAAAGEIIRQSENPDVIAFGADFSSLEEVRGLAAAIHGKVDRLHVLINNAGMFSRARQLSTDGFEKTFAVNYLAPYLLTRLLLDLLRDGARDAPSARIVNVASALHEQGRLDFNHVHAEHVYDGAQAYADSKLALVLFTYSLAERLKTERIMVNCLHPGTVNTKLLRAAFGAYGQCPEEAARLPVYLAAARDMSKVSGRYFAVMKHPTASSPLSYDRALGERLWQRSEAWTGFSETWPAGGPEHAEKTQQERRANEP